jgi:large subunit ribosomal protein L7/L12
MLELTFIEAHQMVKFMEKEYGVAPMAMAAAPVGAPAGGAAAAPAAEAAAAAPAEEKKEEVKKTSFTIKLEGFDAKDKIKVIKEVRAATGLGLKESKELVEAAPKVIKANMNQADCDALVAKLKEAGAKITIE